MSNLYLSRLILAIACTALSACGGGGGDDAVLASTTGNAASAMAVSTMAGSSAYAPGAENKAAPDTWTECAAEDGTCNFSGNAEVRYGVGTNFVTKVVAGPVSCSNAVFGDPVYGEVKSCSVKSTLSWTECAVEDGTCQFTGSKAVRYGTSTTFVTQTLTGPVSCSNATFGDPALGIVKSCMIEQAVAAPVWKECASEGGTCTVKETVDVRYGAGNNYVTKAVTGTFACDNATFGDPAPNEIKSCMVAGAYTSGTSTPQTSMPNPVPTPVPAASPVSGAITTVQLINPTASAENSAAATFGQSFAEGDVPAGSTLTGKLSNGSMVPLQVDAKARHADGSLRHAVITAQLPTLASKQAETVGLVRDTAASSMASANPNTLLAGGFTASFNATVGGVRYSASADELLKSGKFTTWLAGPLATEWLVSAPLKTASGVEHPHLAARFAVRFYPASNSARVDVTVENGWAHVASPSNFTYDAQVLVGGKQTFAQAGLNHYSHARWRKVFSWGNAQTVDVRHNTAYLIKSKAMPNYDQSLAIRESAIAGWSSKWNTSGKRPMESGLGTPYMPTTGARPDIGPMPAWSALYLLSMDQRMKDVTIGMSELAGGWSAHYRNKATDRPVTLAEFPYLTLLTRDSDTLNPATGKLEAFPGCGNCSTPMIMDTAHQPAFSYVPYLVTGDYYHLEELQFWANASSYYSHPDYRQANKGLVKSDQIRGQAWSLRTLAEAAYITPDNDPQKANFTSIVNSNIEWYTNMFPGNPNANKLGVLDHEGHVGYMGGLAIAPWQDDFFTFTVGRVVELGFSKAQPLLAWKSKFVVDRMVGSGFCWVEAPLYNLQVRNSTSETLYKTIAEVYKANNKDKAGFEQLACGGAEMAASLGIRAGEMAGEFTASGTQAIMQPALAYSASLSSTGMKAWSQYGARTYKPDLAGEPQYAIVPR